MQPNSIAPKQRTTTFNIVTILLIVVGSVICLFSLLVILTTALGPKVHGTFLADSCNQQSGKYNNADECTGTFTTPDGKVSVDISNGNEVAISQVAAEAQGETFAAYASASSESDVSSSSIIITGSGLSALGAIITIFILGALPLIVGILLRKGPGKSGPRIESGTSAAVQKLRDRQNR